MTRALALALVLASAGRAAAEDIAPAGWARDDGPSRAATDRLIVAGPFGDRPGIVGADVYAPPGGGAAFVVSRAVTTVDGAARDALVRDVVEALRASPDRAALAGGRAQITRSSVEADPAARVVVATVAWTDPAAQLAQTSRLVLAADATRLEATTGECIAGDGAPAAHTEACAAALARLAPSIAAADRVALALPAAAPAPAAVAPAPDAPPAPPAGATATDAPRLTPGPGGTLMTMSPARPATDRRPVYLGAGIVVLAAVFWWNRQRRDRFEREDGRDPGAPRPRRARARPARDDDADDLAAAARGDAPPDAPEADTTAATKERP